MDDDQDQKKLVLLRTSNSGKNAYSSEGVEAYIGDIDSLLGTNLADTPLVKIHFTGPIQVATNSESPVNPINYGVPVFDYLKDEIVWHTVNVEQWSTSFWRIESHFMVKMFQNIPLSVHADHGARPRENGVLLDGGTYYAPVSYLAPDKGSRPVAQVARRLDNGEWDVLSIRSTLGWSAPNESTIGQRLMFKGEGGANHVYIFRYMINNIHTTMFLDTINKGSFEEWTRDQNILWKSFEITFPFKEPLSMIGFAQLMTTEWKDKVKVGHRLYLFLSERRGHVIKFFSIRLRKDGTINFNGNKLPAPEVTEIKLPSGWMTASNMIQVTKLGDRTVLISWQREDSVPLGLVGSIADDGSIPSKDGWTQVEMSFDVSVETAPMYEFGNLISGINAVVVPSTYL